MQLVNLDSAAVGLAAQIEALAAALHDAHVPPDSAAELVAAATTAAMRALAVQSALSESRDDRLAPRAAPRLAA